MKRFLVATLAVSAIAASALCSACWRPVFDLALSASEMTAAKMGLVSTLTVTDIKAYRAERGIFLPRRQAAPVDGIWLQGNGPSGRLYESTSAFYMNSSSAQVLFQVWAESFSGDTYGKPIVGMAPAVGGRLDAVAIAYKAPSWLAGHLYEPSSSLRTIAIDPAAVHLPSEARLLGVGFAADAASYDSLFVVYHDPSLGAYMTAALDYAAWPLSAPAVEPITMPPGFDAASAKGVGYAARRGGDYYLSVLDGLGGATTYRWADGLGSAPAALPAVSVPLVAVLSDGTLLASDGMSMTAFDSAGALLFSFPSGALRFVHERYDAASGAFMAVFARQTFLGDGNDDSGTLRIELFEIPTPSLLELAD